MAEPYDQTRALYREVAAAYDRSRNKTLFERKWLDKVLARCPENPRILYLGCGAGEPVARYLIEQGASLTGVDFAPEMLAIAADRFPDHRWVEADMREFLPAEKFDAVIMWSALFHLTQNDQRRMFPRFAEMLTEGGALMFQTGIEAGEGSGTVEGRPVYHSTLDTAGYETLLAQHGFGDVDYVPRDADAGGFTVWLASLRRLGSHP